MRPTPLVLVGLVLHAALGLAPLGATQPVASPVIHRVTLQPETGVLTITGTGLGPDMFVTVDGQPVPVLPGASDTHLEALAPATVLTTPGTFRLTVMDPQRRLGDAFIVANPAAIVAPGSVASIETPAADRVTAPVVDQPRALGAATSPSPVSGPSPLAVIEDTGNPFRTAIGFRALFNNTTGSHNTASGFNALEFNTSGSHNTAAGSLALEVNNVGDDNTALGWQALTNNTTGSSNTATGMEAQLSNLDGIANTAIGLRALRDNIDGDQNTAIGFFALQQTLGDSNTAIGAFAGGNNTTGIHNIYVGANVAGTAADTNTIRIGVPFASGFGQNATFIAGIRGTAVTGGHVVAIDSAGRLGSASVAPTDSVGAAQVIDNALTASDLAPGAVGTSELADNAVTAAKAAFNYAASTVEGGPATDLACTGCVAASEVVFTFAGLGANAFAGTQAIGTGNLDLTLSTATGGNLTKGGLRFLHDAGTRNTFLGANAGNFTLTGADNTATGTGALVRTTTGAANTAHGSEALVTNTSGTGNTGAGYRALATTTTGDRNTALGTLAGENNTTGSHNIYVGADVTGASTDANTIRLGLPYDSGTGVGQNQTFIAGIWGNQLTGTAAQVLIDANGRLGTGTPVAILNGTATLVTPAAVEQQLQEQQATIADLRTRLARLEALVKAVAGRR